MARALAMWLVAAALAAGCGQKPAPPASGVESRAAPPPPPSGATAEELEVIPQPPPPDPPPPAGAVDAGEGWARAAPERTTYGYRVQVFASADRERAEAIAAEARSRFGEPVYVEFDPPLYKVRVGDCITRHEADTLKDRANAQGYEGSWVAETMVEAR